MIVTCEQCATQFQLADAKIPAGGARVRCSRCKHAFFIEPAGEAPPQSGVERAVHDALDAEAPPSPEATEDLCEADSAGGSDFSRADEIADESDWEFSEAPFGDDAPAASAPLAAQDAAQEAIDDLLSPRPASRPAVAEWSGPSAFAAADDSDEEDLGSPENWDLLAGSPSAGMAAAGTAPASDAEAASLPASRTSVRGGSASFSRPQVAEWIEPTEPSRLLAWVARSGHAAGWSVTAALLALMAIATLGPGIASDADSEPGPGKQHLAQLEAQGIAGRWVENAAGPLFVVSGRLVNPTAAPMPLGTLAGVRLLDASGARLAGDLNAIGPVMEARELREADPAALQSRQLDGGQNLALTSLQPGQSMGFEAVVVAMPMAASRFVLEPIPPGRHAAVATAEASASAR